VLRFLTFVLRILGEGGPLELTLPRGLSESENRPPRATYPSRWKPPLPGTYGAYTALGNYFSRSGIGAAQLGVGRGPNAHRGPPPGSIRARRKKKVETHDRNDDCLAEKHAECGEFFHGRES
jgi:hypothetical protein